MGNEERGKGEKETESETWQNNETTAWQGKMAL